MSESAAQENWNGKATSPPTAPCHCLLSSMLNGGALSL